MTSSLSIRLNPDDSVYTVAFLLQPHFSMLAFTAAADALTTANLVLGYGRFRFLTVGQGTASVISDLGIQITADKVLTTVTTRAPLNRGESTGSREATGERETLNADAFIVCGGYRCDLSENPLLSNVLRECVDMGVALGGLWNGVVATAHAGLMSGYACALHPGNQSQIACMFPDLQIRPDTVVIDRNRLSAAGPNSAFDLMLLLIQRQDSADTVQAIRKILRADVGLSDQIHDAIKRDDENQLPVKLRNALTLMRGNLEEPLNRTLLAQGINLSTRAMERLFQTHLKTSPAKHYMELRLLRAKELLIQSESSVGEISGACGFVSGAHFSRAFHKRFGCAPRAFRRPKSVLLET
ncbi:MAG: GlxA family transcriptional regulator [Granulosicoccus sp.]